MKKIFPTTGILAIFFALLLPQLSYGQSADYYNFDKGLLVLNIDQKAPINSGDYVCYTKKFPLVYEGTKLSDISVTIINSQKESFYEIELILWGSDGLAGDGGTGYRNSVMPYNDDWNFRRNTQAIYATGNSFEDVIKDLETKINGIDGEISITGKGDPHKGKAVIHFTTEYMSSLNSENNLSESSGTFTDKRDNQTYKWAKMKDGKIWMTENLNYKTSNSWCYDNSDGQCQENGRLYNAASSKNACPDGWHLATDEEWKSLTTAYGGYRNGFDNTNVGNPKKSYAALLSGGESPFNAKLAGYRDYDGSFIHKGKITRFYASNGQSYRFWENYGIIRSKFVEEMGFYCRCVKD